MNNKEPLQIKWKLFLPWLMQQPDEREFNYCDIRDCLMCKFVKETHGEDVICSGDYIDNQHIPKDLIEKFYGARLNSESRRVVYGESIYKFEDIKKHFQKIGEQENA